MSSTEEAVATLIVLSVVVDFPPKSPIAARCADEILRFASSYGAARIEAEIPARMREDDDDA